MIDLINKALNPIKRRVSSLVRLGILTLIKDGLTQEIQATLLSGETIDKIKFLEGYGLTVKPLVGSETIVFNVNGNPNNPIALCIGSRKYRFSSLDDGEVCLYTWEDASSNGHRIHFKKNRIVEVYGDVVTVNADTSCTVNTANATINASEDCVVNSTNTTVEATETASITATSVGITASGLSANISGDATLTVNGTLSLGGSGAVGIARLGDVVTVGSGSSAGDWPITSASSTVKAV